MLKKSEHFQFLILLFTSDEVGLGNLENKLTLPKTEGLAASPLIQVFAYFKRQPSAAGLSSSFNLTISFFPCSVVSMD